MFQNKNHISIEMTILKKSIQPDPNTCRLIWIVIWISKMQHVIYFININITHTRQNNWFNAKSNINILKIIILE